MQRKRPLVLDLVAVEKAPGRVAVEHHDWTALALVDVVDARAGAVKPSRLEGK